MLDKYGSQYLLGADNHHSQVMIILLRFVWSAAPFQLLQRDLAELLSPGCLICVTRKQLHNTVHNTKMSIIMCLSLNPHTNNGGSKQTNELRENETGIEIWILNFEKFLSLHAFY